MSLCQMCNDRNSTFLYNDFFGKNITSLSFTLCCILQKIVVSTKTCNVEVLCKLIESIRCCKCASHVKNSKVS